MSENQIDVSETVTNVNEKETCTQLERTLVSRQESLTLMALRDALLPKLISGELRVREAEKRVEALV